MEQMMAIQLIKKDDLEHFGIKRKSGRYPWGSGKRPYQSGGGTGASKTETPEERESRKQQALKSARSATQIAEFANELSYNELDQALKRIELNQKLDKYVKAEKEAGFRKIDDTMTKVGKINSWGNNVVQSLNNINAIVDLWNSVESAKKGEYRKYKEYIQQRSSGDQQQQSQKKKKK